MKTTAAAIFAFALATALSGCGQKDTDPGPGGVTVGEAKALDQAAEMLDARQLPPPAQPSGQPQAPASDAAAPARQ